jgi:threonine/homoserine/homoserine lactone efflux protein
MTALSNFLISFILSFVGSIPPGTINLFVIQLGLQQKLKIAIRFSIAAALIEYPYAWIAVRFEHLLNSSLHADSFNLIGAIVMGIIGVINLWPAPKTESKYRKKISNSGFRRGLLVGMLNPLAIPYWLGVTAYLNSQKWIDITTPIKLHAYLFGVMLGALLLLISLSYLGKMVEFTFKQFPWIKKIPGILLIVLSLYGFIQYFTD